MFNEFRQSVKALAKEQHLTYAQMAKTAGIEESTIKAFMCGANDSRRTAENLADVLGVKIVYQQGTYNVLKEENEQQA